MIHLQLHGTFGANLRDKFWDLIYKKKITYPVLEEKFLKIEIEEKYWDELLAPANYRLTERTTDKIELLLEKYVHHKILSKILQEEELTNFLNK